MSSNTGTIYLCSGSSIKKTAVNDVFKNYNIVSLKLNYSTDSQPFGEGTALACFVRIIITKDYLEKSPEYKTNLNDMIVSLENGIFCIDGRYYDICIVMVYTYSTNTIKRYNSFGIEIDRTLYDMYQNSHLDLSNKNRLSANQFTVPKELAEEFERHIKIWPGDISGSNITFGNFLSTYFGVASDNWMIDARFGNTDRCTQIKNCLNKFMIDHFTERINDFPKKGVVFKHISSIMIDSFLLNTLYDTLETFIKNNFDVDQIDYFAGLDARGFYFAPVVARTFKKGFIPIRKVNKVPPGVNPLVTESYGTEYSKDEFGLEKRNEFKNKNVLILDDLLATGGSLIGASAVLTKAEMKVVGAVTVYDVLDLRKDAITKLQQNNIICKVMINDDGQPNDFAKLSFRITDVMLDRLKYLVDKNKNGLLTVEPQRMYTMTTEEWTKQNLSIPEDLKNVDLTKIHMNNIKMIFTEKDKDLANKILKHLNETSSQPLDNLNDLRANVTNGLFSNGETRIKIDTNIRGKHVIVVSRIRTSHINDDLMELIMILDASYRASAEKITVIMPYYPYSRSDKKDDPRCPIGAAIIAKFISKMHVTNLVSVDLHAGQIQGYIDKGFHNLYMKRYMCEYIYQNYLIFHNKDTWNDKYILIAPDAGSAKTIKGYSNLLKINNIILDKQRDYTKPGTVVASRFIGSKDEFKGKTGIIIDDMADTMGTMCSAAKELVDNGLKDVIVFVTHGILSGPAIDNINNTPYITEVVVSDTLPQDQNIIKSPKIRVISCSELIARTIDGILTGRSISLLF
jgi:ribose-phosphate pyrophosphokinase